ncbi:hypothetical protein BN1110_06550 [bacterium YEK0313]|nr:hypothetical protein BN1110_06550 [bacterium YEK0313]
MKIPVCKYHPASPDVIVELDAPFQARATAGFMSILVSLALATGVLSGLAIVWRSLG